MSDQAAREKLLQRKFGMSPEGVANLRKFNEQQTDWWAICRKCGKKLEGTLEQVRKCDCGQ